VILLSTQSLHCYHIIPLSLTQSLPSPVYYNWNHSSVITCGLSLTNDFSLHETGDSRTEKRLLNQLMVMLFSVNLLTG
jgi:hypothetical protein